MQKEILTRRELLQKGLAAAGALAILPPSAVFRIQENSKLTDYLNSIGSEQRRVREILENHKGKLMSGIKNLSKEQLLADHDTYYPMYHSVLEKYGIPPLLTWIIHTHETTASRDPNADNNGHFGAMQLSAAEYEKPEIAAAPQAWEFLSPLPQRYSRNAGWETDDWKEFLRFGAFIRIRSGWGTTIDENGTTVLDPEKDEELILNVIRYRYSAAEHGEPRIRKYFELKTIFSS